MLVNAISRVNLRSALLQKRSMSGLPKYESTAGIGMSYAIPILGFFGLLMGIGYMVSPFQNRDKTKIYTEKYQQ